MSNSDLYLDHFHGRGKGCLRNRTIKGEEYSG